MATAGIEQKLDHLTKTVDHLTNTVDHLTKTVGDMMKMMRTISSKGDDQGLLMNAMRTDLALQGVVVDGIQRSGNEVNSKVERLTKISTLVNTKLKEEITINNSDTKQTLDRKLHQQTKEIKTELTAKIERMQTSSHQPSSSSGQTNSDVMTRISGNIDTLSATVGKQEERVVKFEREMRAQGHSIIDQVITEAQITRGIVSNTPTTRKLHTCDFHVTDFTDWIGSSRHVYSRVWCLDGRKLYVKGAAIFYSDKTLAIYLTHGCYPNVLGLQPRQHGDLDVNVKVMKQDGSGEIWDLGGVKWGAVDESNIPDVADGWVRPAGKSIARISCDELKQRGLVFRNKVLLRFEIKVL